MNKFKSLTISLIAVMLAGSLVGCGSTTYESSSNTYSSSVDSFSASGVAGGYKEVNTAEYDGEYIDEDIDNSTEVNNQQTTDKSSEIILYEDKLVYRCDIEMETLSFEEAVETLHKLMDDYNCIIQSERFSDDSSSYLYNDYYNYNGTNYVSGRVDYITIRVPSKNYKAFIDEYSNIGNITSKNQSVDNITQTYYDTTSQVEGLEAEMVRLEEMMRQAVDIEDMITINQAITDLQSEINSLTTQIRTMDSDVAYSYVTLTLKEVLEYSEAESPVKKNTFVDRLKNQFIDTWNGLLKFCEWLLFTIIGLIPAIVIIGGLVLIIRKLFGKKIKEKIEKNKASASEFNSLINYKETTSKDKDNNDGNKNK